MACERFFQFAPTDYVASLGLPWAGIQTIFVALLLPLTRENSFRVVFHVCEGFSQPPRKQFTRVKLKCVVLLDNQHLIHANNTHTSQSQENANYEKFSRFFTQA